MRAAVSWTANCTGSPARQLPIRLGKAAIRFTLAQVGVAEDARKCRRNHYRCAELPDRHGRQPLEVGIR